MIAFAGIDRTMTELTNSVTVSKLLKTDSILFFPGAREKTGIIDSLIQHMCKVNPELNAKTAMKRVMQREQESSTVVDTGFSIPHARMDDIDGFSVALGLIPDGVQDPGQPGITVKAMFLFLSPINPQFLKKHLQLLAALSALFQPALIDRLVSLNTEQQVMETIISSE